MIALSECTPQGIVLSEINAGEGTVHITGTADSPVTAMRFQKELEKAWGGKTYIEKQKREPNLKWRRSLFCGKAVSHEPQ